MRLVMAVVVTLVALTGCDNAMFDDELRKGVRATLKDPTSAQWGDKVVVKNYACIVVNAKNAMGGYGGKEAIFLKKDAEAWSILAGPTNCDTLVLERMAKKAESDQASRKKVQAEVGARLQANSLKGEDCKAFANELIILGGMASDSEYSSRDTAAKMYADGLAKLDLRICE